jgi:hypothetical protein
MTSILFITHPYPNYVPDLLLHGLRKLLGHHVVDYPRKDCLYEGILGLGICPTNQRCPGWFPDDEGQIDRTDIWTKVRNRYFDLIVCDLRALKQLSANLASWPDRCAVIDGEDHPYGLQPGPFIVCRRETDGLDYSIPLPMALPEEIFMWISQYDTQDKQYDIGFLGSTQDDHRGAIIKKLANHYPNSLFQLTTVPSEDLSLPEGRMSRDQYYRMLQQCRMVLSLPGAGMDTFRFWENTACHSMHLALSTPLLIPSAFIDNQDIVFFSEVDELRSKIDATLRHQEITALVEKGRTKLLGYHLTHHRAEYFLNRVTRAFSG